MGRCHPPVGLDIGQESPPWDHYFKKLHDSSHCTQDHNLPRLPSQRTALYDPRFSYLHKILALRIGQCSPFKVSLVSQYWVFGASYLSSWVSSVLFTCLPTTGSPSSEMLLEFNFACISALFRNISDVNHLQYKSLVCDV